MRTWKEALDQLFFELACFVGEGVIRAEDEETIIAYEEDYRATGDMSIRRFIELKQLLNYAERNGGEEDIEEEIDLHSGAV